MPENGGPRHAGMLTSWKEIASFFRRDVRTVQRWEREEGLPVHRHKHQRGSSVYAYSDELDTWWNDSRVRVVDAPVIDAASLLDSDPLPATSPPAPRRPKWLRWAVAGAAAAVATLSIASLFLFSEPADYRFPIADLAIVSGATAAEVSSMSDLSGDGRADLVVNRPGSAEMLIYLGAAGSAVRARPDVRIVDGRGLGPIAGGSVGDVDGDGLADLMASVFFTEPASYSSTGSSYLIRGRRSWPAKLRLPDDADTEFHIDYRGDIRMGGATTPAGADLNGDGLGDLVLGGADYSPPGRPSAGGVFVLFGRRTWPKRLEVVSASDVVIHGSRSGEGLTYIAGVGDFTGDGRTDLALTATESTLWYLLGGRGRVYVIEGREHWPRTIDMRDGARFTLTGSTPQASYAPPRMLDVNGDAVADLVLAISHSPERGAGGRVIVVFGRHDRRGVVTEDRADVVITGSHSFGQDLDAMDLNLDGVNDLLVNEPLSGITRLIAGRRQFSPRGDVESYGPLRLVSGVRGSASNGIAAGDFDGDGIPEVALESTPNEAGGAGRRLSLVTAALSLGVDVRPQNTPNVLVPGGVVAIAVAEGTLAGQLDDVSFRFAGASPSRVARQDFDGDGRPDLRLYFDVARLSVRPETTRLAVRAVTRAGLPVGGADDVVVVPSQK